MGRTIFAVGLIGVALGLPWVAGCDELEVPPGTAPDGGSSGTVPPGGGGTLPTYAPQGAIAGEIAQGFGTTIATWATRGADGKIDTLSWNLPLSAVTAMENARFDARTWVRAPAEALADTSITAISFDYMASGHVPNGVYNVPHWEFHIALQDFQQIQAIDCTDPTLPENQIIPMGWSMLPPPDNCFPTMGIHAIDSRAPEFNGQRFSYTSVLIYYRHPPQAAAGLGAKISSIEPKVTSAALKERKSFTLEWPELPAGALGKPGFSPTLMSANYDASGDAFVFTVSRFKPTS